LKHRVFKGGKLRDTTGGFKQGGVKTFKRGCKMGGFPRELPSNKGDKPRGKKGAP